MANEIDERYWDWAGAQPPITPKEAIDALITAINTVDDETSIAHGILTDALDYLRGEYQRYCWHKCELCPRRCTTSTLGDYSEKFWGEPAQRFIDGL